MVIWFQKRLREKSLEAFAHLVVFWSLHFPFQLLCQTLVEFIIRINVLIREKRRGYGLEKIKILKMIYYDFEFIYSLLVHVIVWLVSAFFWKQGFVFKWVGVLGVVSLHTVTLTVVPRPSGIP
jgi:hypothetical protein